MTAPAIAYLAVVVRELPKADSGIDAYSDLANTLSAIEIIDANGSLEATSAAAGEHACRTGDDVIVFAARQCLARRRERRL